MKNKIRIMAKQVPRLTPASLLPQRSNHTVNVSTTIQTDTTIFTVPTYKKIAEAHEKKRMKTQHIGNQPAKLQLTPEELAITENLSIAEKDMVRVAHYGNDGGREGFAAKENVEIARKNKAMAAASLQKITREGFAAGENLYIARKNMNRTTGGSGEFAARENLLIARKDIARGVGGSRAFSALKKVEEKDGETFKDALDRALRVGGEL